MSHELDPQIEGRLLALRHVLAMLAAGQTGDALLERLYASLSDGQEDPGAVPNEAYAIDGALSQEKRLFARELEHRMGKG